MDHVVYLDSKADELGKLCRGEKTMLIRGATGRKMPYGRVHAGDILYLLENNGTGKVTAKVDVISVYNSEKMDRDQSVALVNENQAGLQLSNSQIKRWAGKRYLILIEVDNLCNLDPFRIDKSKYGNMDDWLPVEDITSVKIT